MGAHAAGAVSVQEWVAAAAAAGVQVHDCRAGASGHVQCAVTIPEGPDGNEWSGAALIVRTATPGGTPGSFIVGCAGSTTDRWEGRPLTEVMLVEATEGRMVSAKPVAVQGQQAEALIRWEAKPSDEAQRLQVGSVLSPMTRIVGPIVVRLHDPRHRAVDLVVDGGRRVAPQRIEVGGGAAEALEGLNCGRGGMSKPETEKKG